MTSLLEDLERAAASLRGVTDHEVEIDETPGQQGIYVNFGYHQALWVSVELVVGAGKRWCVTALAWDQTGGVSDELELGEVRFEYLPALVKSFLDQRDKEERELEVMLSKMPEE